MNRQMLYLKVKQQLEDMIKEGTFKSGDKLPSEPLLAKEFQVSRSTLREAIKLLQRQGILTSKNGNGTYVNKNTVVINSSMNILQSTENMIRNSGFNVLQADMKTYEIHMEDEWKDKLKCDEEAVIIERIRKNEEKDLAYTFNIIPKSIANDVFNDGITGSLLTLLRTKLGIKLSYSISEICIPDITEAFMEKAIKKIGNKTILLKQLHFDENDKPIFYSYDYMNNEHIKFFVKRDIDSSIR